MFSGMFFLYKVHSSVSGVNPSLVRDGSSLSECVWLHHNAAAIKHANYSISVLLILRHITQDKTNYLGQQYL